MVDPHLWEFHKLPISRRHITSRLLAWGVRRPGRMNVQVVKKERLLSCVVACWLWPVIEAILVSKAQRAGGAPAPLARYPHGHWARIGVLVRGRAMRTVVSRELDDGVVTSDDEQDGCGSAIRVAAGRRIGMAAAQQRRTCHPARTTTGFIRYPCRWRRYCNPH